MGGVPALGLGEWGCWEAFWPLAGAVGGHGRRRDARRTRTVTRNLTETYRTATTAPTSTQDTLEMAHSCPLGVISTLYTHTHRYTHTYHNAVTLLYQFERFNTI